MSPEVASRGATQGTLGTVPLEDSSSRIWVEVPYAPASRQPTIGYMTGASATPWASIGRDECMDLLKTARYGRLAVTASAMPSVVPVAIELSGADAILRPLTGPHAVVHPDQVVALEADCLDDVAERQWSVTVLGMLVVDQTDAEPGGTCTSPRFRLNTEFTSGWCSGSPSALANSARSNERGNANRDLLRTR